MAELTKAIDKSPGLQGRGKITEPVREDIVRRYA
jgi:hypothetical protein